MITFNLSLDDFSPHPRAGLDMKSIGWCNKLIDKYPGIRIDLFVPAAYCRLGEDPCRLTVSSKWAYKVKDLPDNYCINLHGMFHRRSAIDYKFHKKAASNNDEFQFLNNDQLGVLLNSIEKEFKDSGIKHSNILRPPGWKISKSATLGLISRGYKIAGNSEYFNNLSKIIPNLNKHWINYNWDMIKPCIISSGDVVAYGHTSDWTNNYMNEGRYNLVLDFLDKHEEVDFKFIGDLL